MYMFMLCNNSLFMTPQFRRNSLAWYNVKNQIFSKRQCVFIIWVSHYIRVNLFWLLWWNGCMIAEVSDHVTVSDIHNLPCIMSEKMNIRNREDSRGVCSDWTQVYSDSRGQRRSIYKYTNLFQCHLHCVFQHMITEVKSVWRDPLLHARWIALNYTLISMYDTNALIWLRDRSKCWLQLWYK